MSVNPYADQVKRLLLGHLEAVAYDMPADSGELRLAVSVAFLSGAAVALEMIDAGMGKDLIEYASSLKRRRQGLRGMLNGGGGIIQ
jgi:hypothetical protein